VGKIVLENALEGTLEATRLPVRRATGALVLNGDTLRVRNMALDGAAGRVTGELTLPLAPGAAARGFDLRLATDRLDLQRLHSAAVSTALQGTARVRPQGDALAIDADLADPQRAIALQTQARLQGEQLTIASARLQAQDGIAEFSGTAGVAAPYALALTGTVSLGAQRHALAYPRSSGACGPHGQSLAGSSPGRQTHWALWPGRSDLQTGD
jgi:hypothetical protein